MAERRGLRLAPRRGLRGACPNRGKNHFVVEVARLVGGGRDRGSIWRFRCCVGGTALSHNPCRISRFVTGAGASIASCSPGLEAPEGKRGRGKPLPIEEDVGFDR